MKTNRKQASPGGVDRRQFIKGAGLTLAAAGSLSPFILSGCGGGGGTGGAASGGNTIKVGILHSLTGTMAISESPSRTSN